jgi:trypsin-like peptidase
MKRKSERSASRSKRPRGGKKRGGTPAPNARPTRRASWARQVEEATLARRPQNLDEAVQNFRALGFPEQVALVREIAETRAVELTRAYVDIISVAHGFRRCRDALTGVPRVRREPCVKILVKRKGGAGARDPRRQVPPSVLAYATVGGVRRLCAVPTDVEDAAEHAGAQPHSPRRVVARVSSTPTAGATGVLTCAIERSSEPGVSYVVSCRHVLSPAATGEPDASDVATEQGRHVATAIEVAGVLDDAAAVSLDSQLARVDEADRASARLALGHSVVVAMSDEDEVMLPEHLYIVTPTGAIEATVNAIRHTEHFIDYGPGRGREIRHETLIEVETSRPTRGGDSGSPVLTGEDDGVLVGMLIAGPPDTAPQAAGSLSYIIPAWHVLDPQRYRKQEEQWKLMKL